MTIPLYLECDDGFPPPEVFVPMISVADIIADFENEPICAQCEQQLNDFGYYDDDYQFYCEACINDRVMSLCLEAETFAEENCKITAEIPERPDVNSCRHCCSNYYDLIRGLDRRFSVRDQVFYEAIRCKINSMINSVDEE